jgi:TonB-linked SusC/RagA family outer membrane protein
MEKKLKLIIPWSNSPGVKKMLLCMKLTLVISLVAVLQTWAAVSYSQTTTLSISLKNATVQTVLQQVEDQSEFYFLYSRSLIDVDRTVDVQLKDAKITDVLNTLFRGTDVAYKVDGRQIVLSRKSESSAFDMQQQKTVTGKIIDSTGGGLPGVSVVVKGTTTGTITDLEGNYLLGNVPANATVVFSFVGMRSQEIVVGDKTTINVTLADETIGLEEVVAVGYGVQKKVNLTGSISSVKFGDELDNRPITNGTQALGGKVSGVWVSQNSGKPGSDGAQLRVRGWGTMNNSNPLVIIDGVEGSFEQLNPNDIESMSVLKDAASAAIYGSKAANGVILITTKQGKNNEKLEVNLSSYIGVQSLGRRYDLINNSAESMKLSNLALANGGSSPVFPDNVISAFENGTDKYKYPNTDWFDELFKPAIIQEHNVSIRGGSQQTSSFLSFNYLNQDGMVPNTNTERYGIRANLETKINSWLKVSGRLNYSRRVSEEPYADVTYGSLGRVFEMLSGAAPYIAPYTQEERFGSVQAIDEKGSLLYDNRNPLIDAANGKTTTEENFVSINTSAEVKFSDDLLLKTTFASTGNWNMMDKYNQSVYGYTDSGVQTITKNYNREGIEMNRNEIYSLDNNLFTTLNYNKKFANVHDFSAIAGMQLESNIIKNLYARRTSPPKEGLTQVDAGTTGIQGNGNMVGLKMFSYFGRVNYSYSDKYLFEANLRADASSRFKKGSRWGVFPGFSAGWRLGDENIVKNLNLFTNLKLRASWGQLGNQSIAGYWPYLTVIDQNNSLSYSNAGTFAPGAAVTSLIDNNISWETTATLDFGMDIGLFNGKVNIVADYFRKNTSNIIVQLPIPLILGEIQAPFENVGEMLNTGLELDLNYDNQVTDRNKLGYNISVNMTYINNEVTKFNGNSPDQLYLIREKYSYKSLYGYKAIGIYQTDQEALDHMHANSYKPEAGSLKFEDVNNDGKLGYEDKQGLGNTIPKFTFGITPSFKYKGFDLSLLFQGIVGVHAYTQNNFTHLTWENRVISTKWRNAWTPQNMSTNVPSLKYDNTWDNSENSYWVHDLSFVKLKNVQLGYTCPKSLVSKLGVQKIYIYANAQNVFSIVNKDYEGYDPERNTFDSGNNLYPIPRIISFGVNLNF